MEVSAIYPLSTCETFNLNPTGAAPTPAVAQKTNITQKKGYDTSPWYLGFDSVSHRALTQKVDQLHTLSNLSNGSRVVSLGLNHAADQKL